MKLTLEEWRHWLEGARWSLFFSRFAFYITYRLGEKNIRVDALFQQHHAKARSSSQDLVLSLSCFVAAITWNIDRRIEATNPHPQCPPKRLYVLLGHRGDLITWAHTSVGIGHPGTMRTMQLLSARYLWPAMPRDVVRQFGQAEDIVSDRAAQFTSRLWKELLGKLNITMSLTSGYHPQTNGQVERINQEVGKFLCLYCQRHIET
ncbi:hypothetical protein P4O66_000807 [Electrophorus voltai]|uniref:Integrase catalytic domain-containing protein n=1 Tax=Electrophorus voltai TaxID=2609070 RepID=A0AAD8ZEE9_9TELE|nr:hypothetical protein P4O66_000807 [Electrophorus voltai]